jgi:hypothetical protein
MERIRDLSLDPNGSYRSSDLDISINSADLSTANRCVQQLLSNSTILDQLKNCNSVYRASKELTLSQIEEDGSKKSQEGVDFSCYDLSTANGKEQATKAVLDMMKQQKKV